MKHEFVYEGIKISKQNRRNVQDAERGRIISHPFTLVTHIPTRRERDRRAHEFERKALKS